MIRIEVKVICTLNKNGVIPFGEVVAIDPENTRPYRLRQKHLLSNAGFKNIKLLCIPLYYFEESIKQSDLFMRVFKRKIIALKTDYRFKNP